LTRANFQTRLSQWLHRQWLKRGCLWLIMQPLSWAVLLILALRKKFYKFFPAKVYRARLPVLVIGNIYVGGTGKTPVVIALVNALSRLGWKPGVISRGYGVKIGASPVTGQGVLAAEKFGDEPALIAMQTGAMIAVHPNRKKAIEALLSQAPDTNLIIADDGLQHLALARDLEIIVQDQRQTGNGSVMPAGPLRESLGRLERVQAIVTNVPQFSTARQNASMPVADSVTPKPKSTEMALQIRQFRNLKSKQCLTLAQFQSLNSGPGLAAVAAIGTPERFFESLRAQGFALGETLALPDHYRFTPSTFSTLHACQILITAKDAVKCQAIEDPRLWVVEVDAIFSDPLFTNWLDKTLRAQCTIAPHNGGECLQ